MNQHRVIDAPRPAPAEIAEEEVAFTAADFLHMIDCGAFEDMRVELVGGRLIKMMPGGFGHGSATVGLAARLYGCVDDPDARLATDLAVRIDALTVLGPDIALLREGYAGQKPIEAAHILLAIEVADTSLVRDLGQKQRDYARAGVPHYWVVDVNGRIVHAFGAPGGEGYAEHRQIAFGAPLAIPGSAASIILD